MLGDASLRFEPVGTKAHRGGRVIERPEKLEENGWLHAEQAAEDDQLMNWKRPPALLEARYGRRVHRPPEFSAELLGELRLRHAMRGAEVPDLASECSIDRIDLHKMQHRICLKCRSSTGSVCRVNAATERSHMVTDFMTTNEVADYLHTPVDTVRYWRYARRGPACFKLGRRVLYSRADVDTWLEAEKAKTAKAAESPAA